ncbi:unnamed protein product [Camellia sinensis]
MEKVGRMKLGSQRLEVSAQGLGCMSMSNGFYSPGKPEADMIKLIHHAIHHGITFLDTSDVYGPYANEILLGKAMKGGMRERVELCTKFGVSLVSGNMEVHGDPANVRGPARPGWTPVALIFITSIVLTPLSPSKSRMGELKKLVEEGKIKYVGLLEASASTIRRAHAVHPITAVQLEWSLWTRDAEEEIIPTCRELGIGIVAYSPLGRGFFSSGAEMAKNLTENDAQKNLPRFQPDNLKHNKNIFEQVNEMAERKGCTPSQLALAWVHHQGNDVCPIPGTTKIENFKNNIGALSVKLSVEDMAQLESIASANVVKGDRYMSVSKNFAWSYTDTPPLSSWKA